VWGSGRFFRQTSTLVSYFSGSVNGLNPGAPVKFRGVQIGSVTQIRSGFTVAATKPDEFRIPVWFDVDLKEISELSGRPPVELDRARIDELISQGLRAQLQLESFVTGVLYVGLDFFPGSPVVLVHEHRTDILEIPTIPTGLERASQVLTKVMGRIENVDIEAVVHSFTEAVDGVNALVRSPELDRTITAAREALQSIRRLSDSAEPSVQPMMKSLEATGAGARASLQHLDAALADLELTIDTGSPLNVELLHTLSDVGDAARSVKELANYLERNPNALLTGRPLP
jgi:paraquat-inducible protein B